MSCRECLFVKMDHDGVDVDGCIKEDIYLEQIERHPSNQALSQSYEAFNTAFEKEDGAKCQVKAPDTSCPIVPPRINAEEYWRAREKAIKDFERQVIRLTEPKRISNMETEP